MPLQSPRSSAVITFYEENPTLDISKSLTFLKNSYPDTDSWVVDSGVAVQVLTDKKRARPYDIDIVCLDEEMQKDFSNTDSRDPRKSRYIDVKSIKSWLLGRVIGVDERLIWDHIVATSTIMDVEDVAVRVIHPAVIAAGKSILARMTQRPKDLNDLNLYRSALKNLWLPRSYFEPMTQPDN